MLSNWIANKKQNLYSLTFNKIYINEIYGTWLQWFKLYEIVQHKWNSTHNSVSSVKKVNILNIVK